MPYVPYRFAEDQFLLDLYHKYLPYHKKPKSWPFLIKELQRRGLLKSKVATRRELRMYVLYATIEYALVILPGGKVRKIPLERVE